jgi:hypothetical protein
MCRRHRRHWAFRDAVAKLGFLGIIALSIPGLLLLIVGGAGNRAAGLSLVGMGTPVLVAIWLIVVPRLQRTAIRCVDIKGDTITLTNVSQVFVDALELHQNEEESPSGHPSSWRPPNRTSEKLQGFGPPPGAIEEIE